MSASKHFFRASAADFKKVPGSPIAYWVPHFLAVVFDKACPFNTVLDPREGLTTGNNEKHVRFSFEVSSNRVCRGVKKQQGGKDSKRKWFPYNKGGDLRKWYGNDLFVVNWENDGFELQNTPHPSSTRIWAHNFNLDFIFRPFITWSDITSKGLSVRAFPEGYLFDCTGQSAFEKKTSNDSYYAMAICNSTVGFFISKVLNPTMHFKSGDFGKIPFIDVQREKVEAIAQRAVFLANKDWQTLETSWDFTYSHTPAWECRPNSGDNSVRFSTRERENPKLSEHYQHLRSHWQSMTNEMQHLEEKNNRIFIEAYGLQNELTPEVSLKEITLTCNPHYRYGGDKTEEELEILLLADTMKEFISYAVGCMFGRYALDKEGLILANQGETLADYLAQVPDPAFMPDDDNVIPVLDGEWFTDDVTERFRRFVKVTFGEEHYQENLAFIEQSIGKDIRKYFLKDFYADHVKRYKKRPIYWMFSSPKGSFNALIYMHRYQPTTASVVLNGYLREFRTKLIARKEHLEQVSISASVSQRDKTQALKEIEKLKKIIDELESWERDVLYPLAAEQIDIDLDDGVKVNYPKFGKALKKVVGLS